MFARPRQLKTCDLELSDHNIDRTLRIGAVTPTRTQQRPIILKLVKYADRNKVFTDKKNLKNSGISITESLTTRRMEYRNKMRQEFGFKNVLTVDTRIIYLGDISRKPKTYFY